jgi:hypothetical protein
MYCEEVHRSQKSENLTRKFVSDTPLDYFITWTCIRFRKILKIIILILEWPMRFSDFSL